ncbi:ferritin [bacterium]|nr:ferritin [bacterium]
MLSQAVLKALNDQINFELYSGYIYLSMAAYFETKNLKGCATWMRAQAKEEHSHAMRIYDFIVKRMGAVKLAAIAGPKTAWESPLAAFQDALKHEQAVTKRINSLVALAGKENDTATGIFLQWFVTEQLEEEEQTDEIVQKLRMIKDSANGLFMIDHALGKRTEG